MIRLMIRKLISFFILYVVCFCVLDAGAEELLQKKEKIFCVIGKQAASIRQTLSYAPALYCFSAQHLFVVNCPG
jgi:predicted secreted Zn-dependent protease